ncbi:carbohydrate ABC transporter permease [Kribbella alba]|uniref:Carbohydrate ABC transporter permease n=1 Tax=Kribbella alba TaxID=190197 RepID=A0ABN2F2A8_9ACTN
MKQAFSVPGRVLILICLFVGSVAALFPLVWLLSTSLKKSSDVFAVPPQLIPTDPTLANFGYVWTAGGVQQYFLNSVIIAAGTVIINVGCATLAGYAFSRLHFPGRGALFVAVVATMVIPFPSIMISLFGITKTVGLYGSLFGVMIPLAAVNLWLSVYIMKNAFAALPLELQEAAFIDGASDGRVFLNVMLPLVKAPMATAAILVFTVSWSDFLWPLVVLRDPSSFPISIGLQYFMSMLTGNWHNITAIAILASVPTVAVFLLLQRYFFGGTLTGATKG